MSLGAEIFSYSSEEEVSQLIRSLLKGEEETVSSKASSSFVNRQKTRDFRKFLKEGDDFVPLMKGVPQIKLREIQTLLNDQNRPLAKRVIQAVHMSLEFARHYVTGNREEKVSVPQDLDQFKQELYKIQEEGKKLEAYRYEEFLKLLCGEAQLANEYPKAQHFLKTLCEKSLVEKTEAIKEWIKNQIHEESLFIPNFRTYVLAKKGWFPSEVLFFEKLEPCDFCPMLEVLLHYKRYEDLQKILGKWQLSQLLVEKEVLSVLTDSSEKGLILDPIFLKIFFENDIAKIVSKECLILTATSAVNEGNAACLSIFLQFCFRRGPSEWIKEIITKVVECAWKLRESRSFMLTLDDLKRCGELDFDQIRPFIREIVQMFVENDGSLDCFKLLMKEVQKNLRFSDDLNGIVFASIEKENPSFFLHLISEYRDEIYRYSNTWPICKKKLAELCCEAF